MTTGSAGRHGRRLTTLTCALILLVGLGPMQLVAPLPAAAASTWVVESLADDGSNGTLRYAIERSNEGDVIAFAPMLHGTITLDDSLGELLIEHALTIEGPGSHGIVIDGDGETRVLHIEVGDFISGEAEPEDLLELAPAQAIQTAVRISGLTFRNGSVFSDEEIFDAVGGNVLVIGSTVQFEDCVFEDGLAIGGGGIAAGMSYVLLTRCTIRNNTVGGLPYEVGFSGGGGGLITLMSYVVADECAFEHNLAKDSEDAPGLGGGIVALLSVCNFTGCDVRYNTAGDGEFGGIGGGVFTLMNLLMSMRECTVSNNVAGSGGGDGGGGGLFVGPSLVSTVLVDSLIANNTAGSDESAMAAGGGIAAGFTPIVIPDVFESTLGPSAPEPGQYDMLQLHLVNCTVSGNTALGTDLSIGGGFLATGDTEATLSGLSFCTVTDNTSGCGGGITNILPTTGTEPGDTANGLILLKNSIVAGNTATLEDGGDDVLGSFASLGGNIVGHVQGLDSFEATRMESGCGDLTGVEPLLGPLADNGGPTLTHALLPGSPAIDGACDCYAIEEYLIDWDTVFLVIANPVAPGDTEEFAVVASDQRGDMRPVDGDGDGDERCDIGAFEARPDIELPGLSGEASAGEVRVGSCSPLRVRVVNEGDAVLVIDHVDITGGWSGDFSVIGNPSGRELQPGESLDIMVNFCPGSPGARKATLVIYSNDPLDDPLELTLVGRGKERRDNEPEPATMGLSYLRVDPVQVLPGQQVLISANVCNGGEERGSLTATLTVNGSPEESQSVAVSGGSCKQVVFTVARAVPGTYDVSINGMQGRFSVLAPRTVQSQVPSQSSNGLGTWGLIAILVMVGALIAALVYLFRRD